MARQIVINANIFSVAANIDPRTRSYTNGEALIGQAHKYAAEADQKFIDQMERKINVLEVLGACRT